MTLLYKIMLRLSLWLSLILGGWAIFFYFAIMDEVNDETDDMLEDYSEQLIIRKLAGEDLPSIDNGSNNQYTLQEVTEEYASSMPNLRYKDSMIYIISKMEKEPARLLITIFKDSQDQYYELTVSTPTIEKDDLREAILHWMIFLYVFLLFVIIIINIWVYKRSIKPLHKLLRWIDAYTVGTQNEPLKNKTDIKEFQRLNDSIIGGMNRIEDTFKKQKQFIGNASHEIQTPIAICRNRIELLMDDESLSEAQLVELSKIYQTLEYMTKLNKSLILLSKIDNDQFIEKKEINCNELIKKISVDYQEIYAYMNIRFSLIEKGTFVININDTLVSILINNLLKNSFLHNIENGKVEIEINTNSILFKNTGDDTALKEDLIFDRFYQGSKKKESTGLGLAIVKSICNNVENVDIQYFFKEGFHCFELKQK